MLRALRICKWDEEYVHLGTEDDPKLKLIFFFTSTNILESEPHWYNTVKLRKSKGILHDLKMTYIDKVQH